MGLGIKTTPYADMAMKNFRKALKNDPNGFNVSYSVGYGGIKIWKFLERREKELVLDRLRYTLKLRHWYLEYIYSCIRRYAQDPELLQDVTAYYALVLRRYKGKTSIEKLQNIEQMKEAARNIPQVTSFILHGDWKGKAYDGRNIYKDGNMHWSGTIDAALEIPRGPAVAEIEARGTRANGVYPYMIIEVDGKAIGETFVDSSEWKKYNFEINTDGGLKVLSVTFANNSGDKIKGKDRNLFIDEARVIKSE